MDGREQTFPNVGQADRVMDAAERATICMQKFVAGTNEQRSQIEGHIHQAEQAARLDERRKVFLEILEMTTWKSYPELCCELESAANRLAEEVT